MAESLPFTMKNPTIAPAGNFFTQKTEKPFISYLDLRKMQISISPKKFFQGKSENGTFSYLDHQNRKMEVR